MKIAYFILLGFLFILTLFTITTYINFKQAERVNENSELFSRSTTIVRSSSRFQRNFLNMANGLRGYLFTGEKYFIQVYDSAAAENEAILTELSYLIPDSSAQGKKFNEIVRINYQWITEVASPLIQAKKLSEISDTNLMAFNKLYREKLGSGTEQNINRTLQGMFRDFSNYEYDLRDRGKELLSQSIEETRLISFYLTTLSIVIGVAIAFLLAYRISTRIIGMVRMANNIAAGDYEAHTTDTGSDELSSLAQALNRMARVLSENITLLKRKNEELDQYAHIVSHDLKAPLRGIDNIITWIEEDHTQELSPRIKEYIQLIKGRIVRGENLIQGLLSYARVGREMPVKEETDLNVLLSEIKETLMVREGLTLEIQPNLPTFFTERLPLQQVLANLISNAIKYHDKPDGFVRVYYKSKPAYYEFFVEDNGPGISKNYHDKIFVIFQTLQERDSFESTGVGLAIVKKILQDRKQSIQVNSEAGGGSVFVFTWPK